VNLVATGAAAVDRVRRRVRWVDHLWRAATRFDENFGLRLAAAIAYYGFFAAFAISLLAFSVLGFVLTGNRPAARASAAYLERNLPFLRVEDIAAARGTVAVVGLIGLVFTGVAWVDAMRSCQRAMWRLDQAPGNFLIRWLVDLAMLVGLGLLLAASLFASSRIESLAPSIASGWLGPGLAQLTNVVMSAGLLIGVPRLDVAPRRMLVPVVLVGLGITALTSLGRFYVQHVSNNPAYKVVGAAAGLLVFLYLFSQLLLFGAAWAATGTGRVRDLAAGPPAVPPPAPPPSPATPPPPAAPPA
jgi:membrane protein